MKRYILPFGLFIGLAVAGVWLDGHVVDPPSSELKVIMRTMEIVSAESRFYGRYRHFGAWEELIAFEPARLCHGINAAGLDSYLLSVEARADHYQVKLRPKSVAADHRRSFYVNESGILRQSWDLEPANEFSPPVR